MIFWPRRHQDTKNLRHGFTQINTDYVVKNDDVEKYDFLFVFVIPAKAGIQDFVGWVKFILPMRFVLKL